MVKPSILRVSRRAIDRPRDPASDPAGFGIGMIMAPGSLGSSFYANQRIVQVVTYAADAGSAERAGADGLRMASPWMVKSAWHGWHPAATPSQGLDAPDDSARARGGEQTGTSALLEELESGWQRADASIRASAMKLVKALSKGPATPHAVRKQADDLIVNLEHILEAIAEKKLAERLLASAKEAARLSEVAAPARRPGYQAAVEAGAGAKTRIMAAPEMVNSIELARLMGVTRETVNQKRQKGMLLALTHGTRHQRYPTWQLEPRIMDVMPRLLKILGNLDPWTQYLFITQRNPVLNAASPLDALRRGEEVRVLATAGDYAEAMAPA